jgi:hypothetical protein
MARITRIRNRRKERLKPEIFRREAGLTYDRASRSNREDFPGMRYDTGGVLVFAMAPFVRCEVEAVLAKDIDNFG